MCYVMAFQLLHASLTCQLGVAQTRLGNYRYSRHLFSSIRREDDKNFGRILFLGGVDELNLGLVLILEEVQATRLVFGLLDHDQGGVGEGPAMTILSNALETWQQVVRRPN